MSSIIVLDSSDEEDEAPAKQPCLSRPIPATITSIKTNVTGATASLNAKLVKERKSRTIPSGITVTRHSPIPVAMTKSAGLNTNCNSGSSLSATVGISSAMLAKTTSGIGKPQSPILPKISAAFTKTSSRGSSPNENQRQRTSTPPVATGAAAMKQQLQYQMMPQLQPSPQMRKRKTPTPPQQQRHLHTPPTLTSGVPATTAAATNNTTTATLVPIISSVQSMSAASSTPPLQLLATPPHATASTFNEQQLMISPKLVHNATILKSSTAIPTASMQSSINMNSNSSNFKIQLPPKRGVNATTTSSPMASPALVLQNSMLKSSSNTTATLAQHQSEKVVRRIKPTTVLKHNDEAWMLQRQQQQQQQRTMMSQRSLGDDVMEIIQSTSSSNSPKPPTPTSTPPSSHMSITISPNPPQLIHQKRSASSTNVAVLDLTASPEKPNTTIITLDESPTPTKTNSPSCEFSKLNGESKDDVVCVNLEDSLPTADGDDASDVSKKPPLEPEYDELIKACRIAESSDDMEKLINTKLIKYYYDVHPDFVRSRGFRKNVRTVMERIRADPELVYYNLKTIVDELKVRRKSKLVVMNNEELSAGGSSSAVGSTGNKRTDEQIKKLNKALYILTKRIEKLEEADVDWDDDDSSYLQVERSKKRACQIYEKICDLTGESKNAHRLVKKPIQFNGTTFTQFNKTLQAFINRTKEFPDYYDVMRMLEHCNRQYSLGLTNFEMKRVAQDAFIKVGKLLQSRRKTDLYETVTHFTANSKDPATTDPTLLAKLSENLKNQTKISEIIEKYAKEQDLTAEEQKEARLQEKLKTSAAESGSAPNDNDASGDIGNNEIVVKTENNSKDTENNNEDEEDDDSDTDDGSDIEEHVENLANGDLSDAESDNETRLTAATNKSREEKDNSNSAETNANIDETETTTQTIYNNNNNNNDKNDKERTIATVKPTTKSEELQKTSSKACDKETTTSTTTTTTVNNNVTTRIKTGDMVDHRNVVETKQSQQQQQQQLPNGKLKDVADITAASTSLKIVSVSSLSENIIKQIDDSNINNSRSNISSSNKQKNISSQYKVTNVQAQQQQQQQQQSGTVKTAIAAATTTSTPPIATTTTVGQKTIIKNQSQQQRTLAEIVISDEET